MEQRIAPNLDFSLQTAIPATRRRQNDIIAADISRLTFSSLVKAFSHAVDDRFEIKMVDTFIYARQTCSSICRAILVISVEKSATG